MPGAGPAGEITLGGTRDGIARAAGWAADLAAAGLLPPARLYDVQLCLEEVLANALRHGFGATAEPRIRLRLSAEPGSVLLEIEDNGAPFDPASFATPPQARSLDEARPGGLGIPLLRRFCDGMRYERRGGQNVLTLRFDRDRPAAASVTPGGS